MRLKRLKINSGIAQDLKGRAPWYKHDWVEGINCSYRILAPSTYILFTSAIPAIAFGEQLVGYTDGALSAVQVITATALCGIIQSIFGGQPLLIVGVAEPIVLLYKFLYEYAQKRPDLGGELFLPWCAWVCVWAACMLWLTAASGACRYIYKFTRFSGELFGMLIATLFLQQAVQGLKEGFQPDSGVDAVTCVAVKSWLNASQVPMTEAELKSRHKSLVLVYRGEANQYQWRLVNGLWGLVLALGLLYTSLQVRKARSWLYFKGWVRSFLADYGVPLLVVIWSGLGYAVSQGTPSGIPRRTRLPNTWTQKTNWTVTRRMGDVPGIYIAGALVPALIICILFYFDHSVSSQLAQTPDFNIRKPSAYSYDLLLNGFTTFLCGILGIPPVNGVLPQAPMHTRSLVTLKMQMVKSELCRTVAANEKLPRHEIIAKMIKQAQHMDSLAAEEIKSALGHELKPPLHDAPHQKAGKELDLIRDIDLLLPVEVKEQRVSNLVQSLMIALCLPLTPVLKFIPVAVLWGYFAYMALDSLPGSQFWQRILLLATDKSQHYKLLKQGHVTYIETVPLRVIAGFTLLQFLGLAAVYVVSSWTGIVGVIFPVLIMALVPIRQYILPRFFSRKNLHALDAAEYEEAPPESHNEAAQEAAELGDVELGTTPPVCHDSPSVSDDFACNASKHHLQRESVDALRTAASVDSSSSLRHGRPMRQMNHAETASEEQDGR